MPNVVFDANALVSAALKQDSVPAQALFLALERDALVFSQATFAEVSAVLARPRFAFLGQRRDTFLTLIAPSSSLVEPAERIAACRDPKDNCYLELAVASRSWAIVSGDADLLVLDPFRNVRVLRPGDYIAALAAR